ncbi:MAG TPA: DUF6069 family protein [Streptosporangiaceae bacterium]
MTRETRIGVDAGRLWAGGIATAVVAALAAVAGLLIARGIFHVVVLAPKGDGIWGNTGTVEYALGAAAVAIVATALMHLLCLAVPAPGTFFQWIMVLITLIAVVLPLTLSVALSAKLATAAINLALGLIITAVIHTMAMSARTLHQRKRTSAPSRDQTMPLDQRQQTTYYDR